MLQGRQPSADTLISCRTGPDLCYRSWTSPETPVFLLTGWGNRLIAEGDLPAEVDRILSKPPKLRELREALSLVKVASRQ